MTEMNSGFPDGLGDGRYRLLRELGRGGMATVWLAEDVTLKFLVAIKALHPQQDLTDAERATRRERALREARSAIRIKHPNAVALHTVIPPNDTNDIVYLIMEYVDGTSLAKLISQRGALSSDWVAALGLKMLDVLEVARDFQIVHRDIKPDNIMIPWDHQAAQANTPAHGDRAKLADFGLAHSVDDGRLTTTGWVSGTPQYMAPELLETDLPITPTVDLWSLGATLFHAVEGRSPFARRTAKATQQAITEDPLPIPGCDDRALAEAIGVLLRRDPDERTIEQARAALLRCGTAQPPAGSRPPRGPEPPDAIPPVTGSGPETTDARQPVSDAAPELAAGGVPGAAAGVSVAEDELVPAEVSSPSTGANPPPRPDVASVPSASDGSEGRGGAGQGSAGQGNAGRGKDARAGFARSQSSPAVRTATPSPATRLRRAVAAVAALVLVAGVVVAGVIIGGMLLRLHPATAGQGAGSQGGPSTSDSLGPSGSTASVASPRSSLTATLNPSHGTAGSSRAPGSSHAPGSSRPVGSAPTTAAGVGPTPVVSSGPASGGSPSSPAKTEPPSAAPSSVSVSLGSNGDIDVSWSVPALGLSYYVHYEDLNSAHPAWQSSHGTATAAELPPMPAGDTVAVYVTAANAAGQGPASPTRYYVGPPQGFTASAGNAQVELSWTAISGNLYTLTYRDVTTNGPLTPFNCGNPPAICPLPTPFSVDPPWVANGDEYEFYLTATNDQGASTESIAYARPTA